MLKYSAHIFIGAIAEIAPIFDAYVKQNLSPESQKYYNLIKYSEINSQTVIECNDEKVELNFDNNDGICRIYEKLYNENVVIGSQAEMKLVFYFFAGENDAITIIAQTIKALKTLDQKFTFEFIGLSPDVVNSINCYDKDKYNINIEDYTKNIASIIECKNSINTDSRFILLQNTTQSGASVKFTKERLAVILGEYVQIIIENYYEIYNNITPKDVTGLGVSMIGFDSFYFCNYLKNKLYIKALEQIGVQDNDTKEEVDVNKIYIIVKKLLEREKNVFNDLYKNISEELIKSESIFNATKRLKDEVIAEIESTVDKRIDILYENLISFVNDEELTLIEKQAAFSMLLGYDDELIKTLRFDQALVQYDDCLCDSVEVLLDANNKLAKKIYDEIFDRNIYVPGPIKNVDCLDDEKKVKNPYSRIKEIKKEIIDISSAIRSLDVQLDRLEENYSNIKNQDIVLTDEGFKYNNLIYKTDYVVDEKPLENTYKPEGVRPKKNVDLSKYFTEIRDQGSIGACASFSIASIYEYILKRAGKRDVDLSERFVFYYTNIINDKLNEGSSFYDVIDVITNKGICEEEFFRYNEDLEVAPSPSAVQNAKEHKIVQAMNVEINHNDIVCALSEGYPVAIALKIYNSFGAQSNGLVLMPSKEEIESNKYGGHGMVICGYDENRALYKVRNSWGKDFGDGGYCYIPFDYIEDKSLNMRCCIVTETIDGHINFDDNNNEFIINIDETENKIKRIVLSNKIQKQKRELEKKEREYKSLTESYQGLLKELEVPQVINQLRDDSEKRLEALVNETEGKYNSTVIDNNEKINKYNKVTQKSVLYCVLLFVLIIAVGLLCGSSIWNYWWVLLIPVGIGILTISSRNIGLKKLKDELQQELTKILVELNSYKQELKEIDIKIYLAQFVLKKLGEKKEEIDKNKTSIENFRKNLKQWYSETIEENNLMNCNLEPPLISILNNDKLDEYFSEYGETIASEIKFNILINKAIANKITEENIAEWKKDVDSLVQKKLLEKIADFDMYSYLANSKQYDYLNNKPIRLEQLLSNMNGYSEIFLQSQNVDISKSVILNVEEGKRGSWRQILQRCFSMCPSDIYSEDRNKLVVITTSEHELKDVTL